MKYLYNTEDVDLDLRKEYEGLLPRETIDLFEWKGCQYFWKDPNSMNQDTAHWISEMNFGLRIFLKTKALCNS